MSPALQQVAPAGSIETKLIESKAVSKPASRRMNDIATVTQAEAFTSAAVQLSRASGRLVTEAQHQSKYWEQLASLRSNGWPVSRVPNDAKALVVHYGSADSGPQYRNRGVAALRQDENGDLTFSGQAESQKPETLVVTVHRRGKLTGRFALKKEKSSRRSKLEDDLLQAREALFQEELFNEASKEARILANMGVKTRSSSIEIAVSDECSVAVSYARQPLEVPEVSQADDKLAHFVGNGLRLMLVVEHQQRHLQRAEHKPLPMSQNPRPAPEYALLRPITSLLRHHCDIAPLFETLEDYKASFRLAGLHLSVEHQSSDGTESASPALQLLRRVVTSQVSITLPSEDSLSIRVETHLGAPRFGTHFSSTRYDSECGSSSCAETSSCNDVVRFLGDVLCRDICTLVLRLPGGSGQWQLNNKYPLELLLADGSTSLATLRVACADGRISTSCVDLKKSSKQRVQWNTQEIKVTVNNERQEQANLKLLDIVNSMGMEPRP